MLEALLTLCYTLIFILIIFRMKFFKVQGLTPLMLSLIFSLKVLAGFFLYLVYTKYYQERATADIFKYFDDSRIMFNALIHKPVDYFKMVFSIGNDNAYFEENYYKVMNNWYRVYESNIYNDSHTIIRFNAVVRIFSFGYYNVHTVFMSFLSLCGLTGIYRFFIPFFSEKRWAPVIAVFLIPSVLLWGSGVLKEGLLLFGLGMILFHLNNIAEGRHTLSAYFLTLGSFALLFYTKFYILICILPLLISYFWVKLSRHKFMELKYVIVLLIYAFIGFNIHHFFPGYNVLEILAIKQHDFNNLARSVDSGSMIAIAKLEPNLISLMKNSPIAFYTTLIRPWFFESSSALMLAAGLENLLHVFLMILVIFFFKRTRHRNVIYFSIMFVIFTFTLTGLITPVMGAIVRYKVPAMPFLLLSLFLLLDWDKFVTRINKKIKVNE